MENNYPNYPSGKSKKEKASTQLHKTPRVFKYTPSTQLLKKKNKID